VGILEVERPSCDVEAILVGILESATLELAGEEIPT
jgi:hypothetical protein